MKPAIYSHVTAEKDKPTPKVACDPKESRTRQEFKKDCDVNFLLKKYGANLPMGQVRYGAQEFGVDRLTALNRLQAAQAAFEALPEAVQKQYGSWQGAFSAFLAGEFTVTAGAEVPSAPGGDGSSEAPTG